MRISEGRISGSLDLRFQSREVESSELGSLGPESPEHEQVALLTDACNIGAAVCPVVRDGFDPVHRVDQFSDRSCSWRQLVDGDAVMDRDRQYEWDLELRLCVKPRTD